MFIHAYIPRHEFRNMGLRVHTHIYIHIYIYICLSICVCVHVCLYVYMHVWTYVDTSTLTSVRIRMYMCIHILLPATRGSGWILWRRHPSWTSEGKKTASMSGAPAQSSISPARNVNELRTEHYGRWSLYGHLPAYEWSCARVGCLFWWKLLPVTWIYLLGQPRPSNRNFIYT